MLQNTTRWCCISSACRNHQPSEACCIRTPVDIADCRCRRLLLILCCVIFPDISKTNAQDTTTAGPERPVAAADADTVAELPFVDLLSTELTETWKHYHADPAVPLAAVWKVVMEQDGELLERVLICTGQPKGFLQTIGLYEDFELTLQWKFPDDANGNSGVLVYTQDESRIWPTSMQIQFHQPKAGSVFPSGGAKSDNRTEKTDLARPINMWNDCRIISRGGRLAVEINGTNAGETTGSVPSSGSIALQSEGAVVHFRRMKIRRLEPVKSDPEPVQKAEAEKTEQEATSPETETR